MALELVGEGVVAAVLAHLAADSPHEDLWALYGAVARSQEITILAVS